MAVGRPLKGEDRVEKGVKLIWAAIHREPYTRKKAKPIMEDWNCPTHGKTYNDQCQYCKAIYNQFDHINSMYEGYIPTLPDDKIDAITYTVSGRFPRKKTAHHTEE
jgi:hypothetical protein